MTDSNLDGKCQYCRGLGVALAREDGTFFKIGEIIINENPRIVTCSCKKSSMTHDPIAIQLDVNAERESNVDMRQIISSGM
jgi:hypothetical protein